MARGDDGLQGLFKRMSIAERRDRTIKSILDHLDQAIERMSLKIDDRNLADGPYRSRHDCQSQQPQPHRPPSHRPPPGYDLQHPQFNEFSYEEVLRSPIYHYNDDYEDGEMFYVRQRRVR